MQEIITAFSRQLDAPEGNLRCLATQALGRIGGGQVFPALLERLGDEDEDVCLDAVEALGTLADARAVPLLSTLYAQTDSAELKVAAVQALGCIGGEAAAGVLLGVAAGRDHSWDSVLEDGWDSHWDAQLAALEALGRMGEERAVPLIVAALEDENAQELSAAGITALAGCGPAGQKALLTRLRQGAVNERRQVVRLLARTPESHQPLTRELEAATQTALNEALEDSDGEVRALALGILGGTLSAGRIAEMMADPESTVRSAGIALLAAHANADQAEIWQALLNDPQPSVRAKAVTALPSLMGQKSLSRLARALADHHQEVAVAAVEALGVLDNPAAQGILADLAGQTELEPLLRVAAVEALHDRATGPARERLLELLFNQEPAIRQASLEALAGRPGQRDIAFLLELLGLDLVAQDSPDSSVEQHLEIEPVSDPAPIDTGAGSLEESGGKHAQWPSSTLESLMEAGPANQDFPTKHITDLEPEDEMESGERELLRQSRKRVRANALLIAPPRLPPQQDIRVQAARLLRAEGVVEAVAPLLELLEEPEPLLVQEAAESLAALEAVEAVGPLRNLLGAEEWATRLAALRALVRLNDAGIAGVLQGLWPDPEGIVRREILLALMECQAAGAGRIFHEGLADEDPEVIWAAGMGFLRMGALAALPELLKAMSAHPLHRWTGLGAALLAESGASGVRTLTALLADPARAAIHPAALGMLEEIALAKSAEREA